ncbi:glycosyltransferase [uncultured Algibacter sp.]|uniref:glycosyltransferase family 2 protein n=1 Tax=uncultured Algibacter sp. TaxID=298659 RepID=UPI00262FDD07|nr:glycosyltransferase [uncultured Algibacter sp.]
MLAIVIPYYNYKFFNETLDSLANQTDKRFKVYIGNDASFNNPLPLLETYKNKFDFVYKKFKTNIGKTSLVKQWERCIDLSANEEWLMLLGDDDYVSNNFIEEFYKQIEDIYASNANVVRYATQIDKVGNKLSDVFMHPKIETSPDSFYRNIFSLSRSSLSEHVFKRKAYLKYGFRDFPLAWGADDFAWLEFTEFKNIYTINEAVAYIRLSSENISRKGFKEKEKLEAKYLYFTLIVSKLLNKFKKEQHYKLFRYYEGLVYRSDNISFRFWFLTSKFYLTNKYFLQFLKFQVRIVINYFLHFKK